MTDAQIDRRVRRGQWVTGSVRGILLLAETADEPLARLAAATQIPNSLAARESALALWGVVSMPARPVVIVDRRRNVRNVTTIACAQLSSGPDTIDAHAGCSKRSGSNAVDPTRFRSRIGAARSPSASSRPASNNPNSTASPSTSTVQPSGAIDGATSNWRRQDGGSIASPGTCVNTTGRSSPRPWPPGSMQPLRSPSPTHQRVGNGDLDER